MQNYSKITVISYNFNFVYFIFRYSYPKDNRIVVKILFYPGEKVSEVIERFRAILNSDEYLKFMYNAKDLNPNLTIEEAGIANGSNIFVVSI